MWDLKKFIKYLFLLCTFVVAISCGENIYKQTADSNSDEALLVTAQQYLRNSSFADAITTILSMSTAGQATKDAQLILVSAYSGQCGVIFDDLLEVIENMGSKKLFRALMDGFQSATATHTTACKSAETTLLQIESDHGFSSSDHLRMVFVSMGKIGTILNRLATTSNVITPAFRACNPADVPDADANELFTGLTLISVHIASAGLSNFDSSEVSGVCTILDAALGAGACDKVDSATVTAAERCAIRSLVNEGVDMGLYDTGTGVNLCDEPNPDGATDKNFGECYCGFSTWTAGC